MKKRLLITVVIIALLAGGGAYYFKGKSSADADSKMKTAIVTRGDLIHAVSATGVIEPNFQVEVKSKASGEILSFPLEPGDMVVTGQKLLTLDPSTEKRNVEQREADLAKADADLKSAQASLMEAKAKHSRAKILMSQGLISLQEMESAETGLASAVARVAVAEASVKRVRLEVEDARERLKETVVVSPIDGMILEKDVEKGQIITSGISSVTGGTKLCVVADLTRTFIMALVDETDIGKVTEGQKARITADAHQDKTFEGRVDRVYPKGQESDKITVFKVKVEITGENRRLLKTMMTANVDLILESKKDVLIIPDEAVKFDEKNKKSFVQVLEGGKPVKRPVKTGLSNGFDTEITEGLKEKETVVLRASSQSEQHTLP
ncbi:MAG: efflux RND transporter periplasmic adaptor subunit [Nitrospinae bacterium]|nr:efflux RND transporter periplasmic adaptor subunit [Nitrospinota bacterium]